MGAAWGSLIALLAVLQTVPPPSAPVPTPRIRKIVIDIGDVFTPDEVRRHAIYNLFNALHVKTRRWVIERELLLGPGDPADPELVAETERNLRALSFISEARVWTEPVGDDEVDLHVRTRDKFTLRVELSAGYVGGVTKGRASLGESNLLGYGKSATFLETRRSGKRLDAIGYGDPRLLGTRFSLSANYATGKTDIDSGTANLETIALSIARPFYSLDTRWSYGASANHVHDVATFYSGSIDDTTDVVRRSRSASGFVARRWGPRDEKVTLSGTLSVTGFSYGEIVGPQAGSIRVPPTSTTWSLLQEADYERILAYQKRHRLDSLVGVEDLQVGWDAGLRLGAAYRRETGGRNSTPFLHGLNASVTLTPDDDNVIVFSSSAFGRLYSRRYQGWQTSAFYHHYYQGLPEQTFVFSAAYDAVFEGADLPQELSLGEESGLRGYDAKSFSGNKRLRLNFEDRIFTPFELYSVVVGAVAFADSGYVWRRGDAIDLGDLRTSVGFGLRIGSLPLLKTRVIRIDVAFPLSPDERGGVSISATAGQLIDLYRNADELQGF